MRHKLLLSVALILGLSGWVIFESARDAEVDADTQALLDRRLQQRFAQPAKPETRIASNRLAELAGRGIGQPLPRSLSMEFVAGKYPHWLVTKGGNKSQVKLPFTPGQRPQPESPGAANTTSTNTNPGFLGSGSCAACHQEKYESFVQTPHHLTSRPASPDAFAGELISGSDDVTTSSIVTTSNPELSFQLAERDGRFYQQFRFFDWHCEVPMEIVTGTARMGQSFLYWHDDGLYQTNVSFVPSKGGWVNSPGFPDGNATYERPITPRCLDCHATYVDLRQPPNHYALDSMILGISCERCHGPGAEHVQHHTDRPSAKKAEHITLPSKLSRQQQLDLCGQCHAGLFPLRGDPFAFRPGDTLSEHYIEVAEGGGGDDGVHTSDQLARLSRSDCFVQSEMTCIDCHNPHRNESAQMAIFSQRCIRCHEPQDCGMSERIGDSIVNNCIDCHMPMYESKALRLHTSERSSSLMLRDHHIRIDQESTRIFIDRKSEL